MDLLQIVILHRFRNSLKFLLNRRGKGNWGVMTQGVNNFFSQGKIKVHNRVRVPLGSMVKGTSQCATSGD